MASWPHDCGRDVLHVWWTDINHAPDDFSTVLDNGDLDRLARLRRADDRRRSAVGIALVKAAAAYEGGTAAGTVNLLRDCAICGRGDHGRLSVEGEPALGVSLAHSGPIIAAATLRGSSVGIDLELFPAPPGLDVEQMRGYLLAPGEQLDTSHGAQRALTTTWVRKEAVVKCTGEGLLRPLSLFRLEAAATEKGCQWWAVLANQPLIGVSDLTLGPAPVLAAIAWEAAAGPPGGGACAARGTPSGTGRVPP